MLTHEPYNFILRVILETLWTIFFYLVYLFIWVYFLSVLLFHLVKINVSKITMGGSIVLGSGICFMFFFIYWLILIAEMDRYGFLLEGIIVYPVLGVIMSLIHHRLFRIPGKER